MPRSKEPARKLAEFQRSRLAREKRKVRDGAAYLDDYGNVVESLTERDVPEIDWSKCSREDRADEANRATTLAPFGYDDTTVREFFKDFELDPQNPWHWRELLYYLIESHSRKSKRMYWTEAMSHELFVRSESYPAGSDGTKVNDTSILKSLREDFPEYKHLGTDGSLRKRLIEARRKFSIGEAAVAAWIDDRCERDASCWESSSALFASWTSWAEGAGETAGSQRRFAQTLESRGFQPQRKMNGRGFLGIRINTPDDAGTHDAYDAFSP